MDEEEALIASQTRTTRTRRRTEATPTLIQGRKHCQVLDLLPDGEVRLVGGVLPLQGHQYLGEGGGLGHDLLDLFFQVLCLAALQEQIAFDPATGMGLAGHLQKTAKDLGETGEVLLSELR